jgi:hypothetical protein
MHYGIEGCNHDWKFRTDGYVEQCIPVVCGECGAFGCYCDMLRDYQARGEELPPQEDFFSTGLAGDANPNGKWINPYVKSK